MDGIEYEEEKSDTEYSSEEIIVKNNYKSNLCNICEDPIINNICPMLNIYTCPLCKLHCSIELTLTKCKKC